MVSRLVAQVRLAAPPRRRHDARGRPPAAPRISSALASAIASSVPSSSRCTGPDVRDRARRPARRSRRARRSARRPRIAISSTSDLGLRRRGEDRQRQPDLGVEVLRAGVDPRRQERPADVLDRGLAGRAGDPDHAGSRARAARRGPAIASAASGSRAARTQRRRRRERPARARSRVDDDAPGARLERRRRRTRRRRRARRGRPKNRSPALDLPRVDHRPRRPARRRRRPAPDDSAPAAAAIRSARELDHRARRGAAAQLLAGHLAVVERDLASVLELLALLVALAGDHDRCRPARAGSSASAIAARRSGSTLDARRRSSGDPRAAISSMIASGSSERGLSEVTIATSASRARDLAHQRALVAVAVAAAAEHADQRARRSAAGGAQGRSRASRGCARSRPGRANGLARRRPARSARARGAASASAAAAASSSARPAPRRSRARARAFSTLNCPGSGSRTLGLAVRRRRSESASRPRRRRRSSARRSASRVAGRERDSVGCRRGQLGGEPAP